jgi:hypothetical protein
MPTPTYTALATVTLGSSASSVTFSNIPATYRDLILIIEARKTTTSRDIFVTYNDDTNNSNYPRVLVYGTGSSALTATNNYRGIANASTSQAINRIQIMDYSATDKHKTSLVRWDDPGANTVAVAGRWANTAAINKIGLTIDDASSFSSTSTFSLYGVIA